MYSIHPQIQENMNLSLSQTILNLNKLIENNLIYQASTIVFIMKYIL
jgi:hypothetical protein